VQVARYAALHVERAAAVETVVGHLCGVVRMTAVAGGRDDVDVPGEEQRPAAAPTGEPCHDAGPTGVVATRPPRRMLACARDLVGLEDIGLEPEVAQVAGDKRLAATLEAPRRPVLALVADQRPRQLDQL